MATCSKCGRPFDPTPMFGDSTPIVTVCSSCQYPPIQSEPESIKNKEFQLEGWVARDGSTCSTVHLFLHREPQFIGHENYGYWFGTSKCLLKENIFDLKACEGPIPVVITMKRKENNNG